MRQEKEYSTINGKGDRKFVLSAGDDEPDTFRVKIWKEDRFENETVIYDMSCAKRSAAGLLWTTINRDS